MNEEVAIFRPSRSGLTQMLSQEAKCHVARRIQNTQVAHAASGC